VKSFEQLWLELGEKLQSADPNSGTVSLVNSGVHAIGKKIMEEAGEVWIAAEYQSDQELALNLTTTLLFTGSGKGARNLFRRYL